MAYAATHYTVQPRGLEWKGWLAVGVFAAVLLAGVLVGGLDGTSALAVSDPNLAA